MDPKEQIKEQKRLLTRAQRKIERESKKLETQEKKTLAEVKKLATKGQHDAAKIMAKDIARQRTQQKQMLMMSSQLKSMAFQISSMQTQQNIMSALKGSSQVMQQINADMDVAEIRNVLKEFNKEMGKAEMQGDMVNDAFDMMEDPSQAADAEDVYNGIMGELQLEYTVGQPAVPVGTIASKNAAVEEVKEENDGLEARLAALRM